jgi:hypothetical protein
MIKEVELSCFLAGTHAMRSAVSIRDKRNYSIQIGKKAWKSCAIEVAGRRNFGRRALQNGRGRYSVTFLTACD